MAGGIGVDNVDGARLLYWVGKDRCTKLDSSESSCMKVSNGQVEMELLRHPIGPFWGGIWRCTLEGQLECQVSGVHLAPLRIADIQLPIEKVCIKGRKCWRVGAVEDNGAKADRC